MIAAKLSQASNAGHVQWRWSVTTPSAQTVMQAVQAAFAVAARPGPAIETPPLSVAAWRYYLPALLIWCVRDTATVDVLVDSVAHILSRRSDQPPPHPPRHLLLAPGLTRGDHPLAPS
jgi:hypothetical protein